MTDGKNTASSNGEASQADVSAEDVPVPKRFRWLKRFVILASCLLVGMVLLRVFWGFEAHRRLQTEIDRYRSAGQPVYAGEFDKELDAVADEDNAAILLDKAIAGLTAISTSGVPFSDFVYEPEMFEEKRDAAAELFEANSGGLELIHQARFKPQVAWSPHLQGSAVVGLSLIGSGQRALAKLLSFSASYQRLAGDYAATIRTIHDCVALCEAIESHPTVISNLVAWATYDLAFTLIEDVTADLRIDQAGEGSHATSRPASTAQVEALMARLLDESGSRQAAIYSYYGDRAYYLDLLDSIDKFGANVALGTGSRSPALWDRVADFVRRPLLVLEMVRIIRLSTLASEALAESSWPEAEIRIPPKQERRSLLRSVTQPLTGSPFGAPRELARSGIQIYFRYLARRRMAATALAILLFERDHGRRPSVLTELVPEYLPQVPVDPFSRDRACIRYKPDAEHPILYSIGRNGTDDGGVRRLTPNRRIDFAASDIPFALNGREKWRKAGMLGSSSKAGQDDKNR
ncbi:MAG: hypothetical protein KAV00_01095 [Phycisphaerae bacterium]|nr:hypothetical protein [Phycisphaerae bacterium]